MIPCRVEPESSSFRDPDGHVFYHAGRVYRGLAAGAVTDWQAFSVSRCRAEAEDAGQLVTTRELPADEREQLPEAARWQTVLEHSRVPFVNYPYEWSPAMLRSAALLYLDLLERALAEGISLKDGTSFNVQFVGSVPQFIDVPSFHVLQPGQAWLGYRQFCQLFLFPLLLTVHKRVPFQPWLRGSLQGISVDACAGLMGWRDWLRPGVFTHVVLHSLMEKQAVAGQSRSANGSGAALAAAGFDRQMIVNNVRGLRRVIQRLETRTTSFWSKYTAQLPYSEDDHARKRAFVIAVLGRRRRTLVWDLGCNTGEFSRLAAEHADLVVAFDNDSESIDQLWRELAGSGTRNVLPLVHDVTNPSPRLGWKLGERKSLVDRGRPTLVLCLALIHHLVLGQEIPLEQLVDWLADLSPEVVIEFVGLDDPMVRQILLNRRPRPGYGREGFEHLLQRRFSVVNSLSLGNGQRVLYHLERHRVTEVMTDESA